MVKRFLFLLIFILVSCEQVPTSSPNTTLKGVRACSVNQPGRYCCYELQEMYDSYDRHGRQVLSKKNYVIATSCEYSTIPLDSSIEIILKGELHGRK